MAEKRPDKRLAAILPELNGHPVEEVRDELARIFAILKSAAAGIIQSAPIVILEDATPTEIEFLNRKLGLELLTMPYGKLNGSLPKLSWPKRPVFKMEGQAASNAREGGADEFGRVLYAGTDAGVRRIIFKEETGGADAMTAADITAAVSTETAPDLEDIAPEPEARTERRAMFGGKTDANDIFVYNIFISGISSEAKRQRTIELISKVRGISTLETEELMKRTIVPIIKGVTKQEADEVQKMFAESRIAVQVLKKAK